MSLYSDGSGHIFKLGGGVTATPAGGASLVFNYTTFTGTTPVTSFTNNGSGISGGLAYIAQGVAHHEGGALWNTAQVDIRSFTMSATFQLPTFTATITAGSANITCPSSCGYVNGDGIRFGGNFGGVTGVSQKNTYTISSVSTVGATTTFQIGVTPGGTGTANVGTINISGMSFTIQTSNSTTNPEDGGGVAMLGDANLCGMGAFYGTGPPPGNAQYSIGNSINIKLDMGSNSQTATAYGPGQTASATGLYVNGGPFNALTPTFDLNPYGIALNTGNLMSLNIVYDGSQLVVVIGDTVTGAQARFIWPLSNLTSIVGGNTAWIGFTCGMIPGAPATINTWAYWTGYNARLSAPSFSPTPGVYSSGQTVTISAAAGATIYYSTNGLPPTTASTQYTGPVLVSATQNLQAIAMQSGFTDSLPNGGVFQIATGAPKINFPSGFAAAVSSGQIVLNGCPFLSGSDIVLLQDPTTSGGVFYMGSAWYAVPQAVSTFTTSFTFSVPGFVNVGNENAGFTFCLQNYYQSPTTFNTPQDGGWISGGPSSLFCGNGPCLGYAGSQGSGPQVPGFGSSVCIAFDLAVGSFGGVGLYSGGSTPTGSSVSMASGMNLNNGHIFSAALTYNGTTLSLLLTDTVTSNTYSNSWTVDIPSLVGASTAYVGFTCADGFSPANVNLTTWTM